MKTILLTLVAVTALAAMLFLTGCEQAQAAGAITSMHGKQCTVQFRRDALGTAANVPVPPTSSQINGADVSVSGTFRRIDDEWLTMHDRQGREVWIPKSVILLLRFD